MTAKHVLVDNGADVEASDELNTINNYWTGKSKKKAHFVVGKYVSILRRIMDGKCVKVLLQTMDVPSRLDMLPYETLTITLTNTAAQSRIRSKGKEHN